MSFLKRLQEKPKSVKSQYAFFGACVITGVIGVVWVSTLPVRFTEMTPTNREEDAPVIGIGEILSETKNQIGNIIDWNTETAPPAPTLPENSALGALNANLDTAPSREEMNEVSGESTISPEREKEEEKKPVPSPSPRVILIATTTDQKSE